MTDPVTFDSTSPRFGLPMLFAGQAQKEAFVNESLSILDGVMHCAIEGQTSTPPMSPAEGTAWLVGTSPTGDWSGKAGYLALRQSGQWLFVQPRDGMRVLDRSSGQDIRRAAGVWKIPGVPPSASGGTVIDVEARAMLTALVTALRQSGVFPL